MTQSTQTPKATPKVTHQSPENLVVRPLSSPEVVGSPDLLSKDLYNLADDSEVTYDTDASSDGGHDEDDSLGELLTSPKNPTHKELASKRRIFSPHPQALQHSLSYPVLPLDLDETRHRPRVFVVQRSGKTWSATYGVDMFQKANIKLRRPFVVIRQDGQSGDVFISSLTNLEWIKALKAKQGVLKKHGMDSIHIVPAGSFSYRRTMFGRVVRTFMRLNAASISLGVRYPSVRLAAVVIPEVMYKNKKHLIITQRISKKKNGTYNGMYVFPGGHVESHETLEQGATREFQEETGLHVDEDSLKLRCCWQEVLPPKRLQFLMLVFSAKVVVKDPERGFTFDELNLQKEEVSTLALVPKEHWKAVSTREDCEGKFVEAVKSDEETGVYKVTTVPLNDVTGHGKSFGNGIGSGHRYALKQYLKPFDKHMVVDVKVPDHTSIHHRSMKNYQRRSIRVSVSDTGDVIRLSPEIGELSPFKEGTTVPPIAPLKL